ncbi:MAG: enoyl-CoA hydratase-related protein [Roseicyclus sp.]
MTVLLDGLDTPVATLILNRPEKLNALSDDMVADIFRALNRVAESSASVLVLSGAGRGFCAGFDLSLADDAGTENGALEWMRRQERFAGLVTAFRAIPQPVVAAVNGPAAGAGLGLALACDTRIGSTAARFNCAFVKVGMSSCDIAVSYLLPRAIGTTRAWEMMLTGRIVEADEALTAGLVCKVCQPETLADEARALANQIAENGRFNTWMTKRGAWANLEAGSLQAAIELENRTQILIRETGALSKKAREGGFTKT